MEEHLETYPPVAKSPKPIWAALNAKAAASLTVTPTMTGTTPYREAAAGKARRCANQRVSRSGDAE